MKQRRIGWLVGMAGVTVRGWGGTVPGLAPLGNSLNDGTNSSARIQTTHGQKIARHSPWNVATLRSHAPKPKFSPAREEKVGNKSVQVREVTFDAEAVPGSTLSLYGALTTPTRAASDHG